MDILLLLNFKLNVYRLNISIKKPLLIAQNIRVAHYVEFL